MITMLKRRVSAVVAGVVLAGSALSGVAGEAAAAPARPAVSGVANPLDYVRPGASHVLQFSAGGKWHCSINMSTGEAGCSGVMPTSAPKVRGLHGDRVTPNGIQVSADKKASYLFTNDPKFYPSNERGRFIPGRPLPEGSVLVSTVAVCQALPNKGVRCDSLNMAHGFELHAKSSQRW